MNNNKPFPKPTTPNQPKPLTEKEHLPPPPPPPPTNPTNPNKTNDGKLHS